SSFFYMPDYAWFGPAVTDGTAGAVIGAISATQGRVIIIALAGHALGLSVWGLLTGSWGYALYFVAPIGAILGAIVGAFVSKIKGWA
ncbi:MAG: hypothetical protein ACRED2_02440, partial [Methylocella sp.]